MELMDGKIYLDAGYDSGLAGRPGCRFVVELNEPALVIDHGPLIHESTAGSVRSGTATSPCNSTFLTTPCHDPIDLPEKLHVLFTDDDLILRKLFKRTIQKVAPGWTVREAANGETALKLALEQKSVSNDNDENGPFQLIFMDMYMASVTKQMLGSETIVELRNNGIDCCICGLSANNKEEEFLKSGADAFLIKPFPCDDESIKMELTRILHSRSKK